MLNQVVSSPLSWGDPQYRLHHLGLLVLHRFLNLLYVTYAVDEANRIVYLRSVTWHPGEQN